MERRPGLTDPVYSAFVLGGQRAPGQDIEFTVNQLVEMIARGAREGLSEREDRREMEERYQAASRLLGEATESGHFQG